MDTFTYTDQLIFNELNIDPFKSAHAIALKLGLSPQKVRNRIRYMKTSGLLRPDFEINDPLLGHRVQTEVVASYYPPSIGLQREYVIFTEIETKAQMDKLIRYCDEHPYTHYRAVTYGTGSNLYVQFDIPIDSVGKMTDANTQIAHELGIGLETLHGTGQSLEILPSFSNWSFFREEWNFAENKLADRGLLMNSLWEDFLEFPKKYEPEYYFKAPEGKYIMSEIESKLLRELTINAKIKLDELCKTYGRTKSVISRYISRLKEKVIYRGKLLFREEYFGMNSFQIISGEFHNGSKINGDSLMAFFRSNPLPLSGSIVTDGRRFLIEAIASPIIIAELNNFLWEKTVGSKLKSRTTFIPKTFLYYFYPENYKGKGRWIEEREYIVDQPLRIIKQ